MPKVHHEKWYLYWQKLYQKVIHQIVVANAFARFRIVKQSNTALFSIKTTLCETNNTLFGKYYWKLGKMNARFWKNI